MANVMHRNRGTQITYKLMATADNDGDPSEAITLKVRRGNRVILTQSNDGTASNAGQDIVQISADGGANWIDDPSLVLASSTVDQAGTLVTSSALNAVSGTEPVSPNIGAAHWKSGPFARDVLMRISRLTGTSGTTWETDKAPAVHAFLISNKR